MGKKVFAFGDTQFPFHSEEGLKKIFDAIKKEKPDIIIHLGDLYDQHMFYKGRRHINILTPQEEIQRALELGVSMWERINKLAPKAKKCQLLGNHDLRMAKRIQEKMPEIESLVDWKKIYRFKGVTTLESDRDILEFDNVIYCHGWFSDSIKHAKFFNKSCVHGHLHRPSLTIDGPNVWAMDVGHQCDEDALPLSYTAVKVSKWRKAYGVITNGKPRLELL